MKKIQECTWEVYVEQYSVECSDRFVYPYRWFAIPEIAAGAESIRQTQLTSRKANLQITERQCRNHWERFAKTNDITNWDYMCINDEI